MQRIFKTWKDFVAFLLIVASFACLIPGLTLPLMTISIKNQLAMLLQSEMAQQLLEQVPSVVPVKDIILSMIEKSQFEITRNILQSIRDLYTHGYGFIAFLVLLFSVFLPVVKSVLLTVVLFTKSKGRGKRLHRTIALISKWAMAEVFVVAIVIAYFAMASSQAVDVVLHSGFYWFLAYCLLSIAATQFFSFAGLGKPKSNTDSHRSA